MLLSNALVADWRKQPFWRSLMRLPWSMGASNVVRVALESLGRQPSVISGWMNYVRGNVARLFPRSITALVAGRIMAQWTPADRQ